MLCLTYLGPGVVKGSNKQCVGVAAGPRYHRSSHHLFDTANEGGVGGMGVDKALG